MSLGHLFSGIVIVLSCGMFAGTGSASAQPASPPGAWPPVHAVDLDDDARTPRGHLRNAALAPDDGARWRAGFHREGLDGSVAVLSEYDGSVIAAGSFRFIGASRTESWRRTSR